MLNAVDSISQYEVAKERINQLPNISYDRPDSLTRRNGTLIARFRYGFHWKREAAQADWQAVITRLFPSARIIKTTVDRKRNARCYFSLDVE